MPTIGTPRSLTKFAPAAALGILIGLAGWNLPQAAETASAARAAFETNGNVRLPAGYRQWVHVGTRIKVGGLNILDGKNLTAPQVLNAFVEPSAMALYQKTGKWPEGTQIVKEISSVKTGKGCDPATNICTTELGAGIFEDSYSGLGMMVKDSKRYPAEPGNWGYFAFFRNGGSYDGSARARRQEQCAACHVKLASDTDYVISKAHLALSQASAR